MKTTSDLILEFEKLFRQKLQLNNCKLRKKRQENTPAKDIFLMYWSEFPEVNLIYQAVGVRTQQTSVYERAIRSHISSSLSSIQENPHSETPLLVQ